MKILELFAGDRSIGKVAEERGHEVFSIDIEGFDGIDLIKDIELLSKKDVPWIPDVIWSSTPCETYSIAANFKHRKDGNPLTDFAIKCDRMNEHVNQIIEEYGCIYYIENPVGMLRKMPFMEKHDRGTVTYCSYGDIRMKPTDVFTNNLRSLFNPYGWVPRPMCYNYTYDDNGNIKRKHCHHEAAPRGGTVRKLRKKGIEMQYGGTNGMKNAFERSKIPRELCVEIIIATENKLNMENQKKKPETEEKPKTQLEAIERHLKDFGHITSLDAIREYGITRLSAHINVLRKEGMSITSLNRTTTNRYGNPCNYAVYQLNQS